MHVRRLTSLSSAIAAAAFALVSAAHAADTYAVAIEGAPNGLKDALSSASLIASKKREIATTAALRRLAKDDLENFKSTLQAAGYYAAKTTVEIDDETDPQKPKVIFHVTPGQKFRILSYEIAYTDEDDADRPATLDEAGVKANGNSEGAALQAAQLDFLNALWDKGFPAAKIVSRRAIADLDAGVARALFVFESGPHATFGEIKVSGVKETTPSYLKKLKTWKEGETFEHSKLVAYRDKLAATGLFSSIDVSPGAPGPDDKAPILVNVSERKRRTIGVGASYSTSEGVGGRVFLDYRNLLHHGELAHIELKGTQVAQSLSFNVNKPLPSMPGNAFGTFQFSNETTQAYNARTLSMSAGLSHKWLKERFETRGALGLETSKVRTDTSDVRTYFVSVPLSATWNTENDILNPTKGLRTSLSVIPYTGTDSFTETEFNARSRITFGKDDRFTLAGRTRFGSIFGSPLSDLPSNKRFYAGGGASVRGYGYQEVGPLDANNNPIGGRSVFEAAAEARILVTHKIQLAAFADSGSVSPQILPDFSQKLFIGVGGGVRYLTAVGPIRLDVAVPLDRRPSDRGFQLYISLGQAF